MSSSNLRSEEEGESVITVGSRPTLPTFYVATDEGSGQHGQGQGQGQGQHLRFRNRSADSAVSQDLSYSPDSSSLVEQQHQRSSPSYGTPGSSSLASLSQADSGLSTPIDSGVEGDDSFVGQKLEHAPPRLSLEKPSLKLSLHSNISSSPGSYLFSPEPKAPRIEEKSRDPSFSPSATWNELHRRFFRPRSALFDSSVPLVGSDQVIPMLLMLIVLASSVFTVLMLKQGLVRGSEGEPGLSNGKYASIEFGLAKRTERLKAEGKILPEELADENGQPLKGKRAAIQFAYEVNNPELQQRDPKEETPEGSGDQADLDLEELADLLQTKDSDPKDVLDTKKRLMEKIGKFGHFTTTKVEPKPNEVGESEEEEKTNEESETNAEKEAAASDAGSKTSKSVRKRTPQSARENPLRSAQPVSENQEGIIGREDDPFRFVQN